LAFVHILLSSYNGATYLGEQLDSLAAQTHQDFNVYLRDDGSSDDTVAVASAHPLAQASKLRVHEERHVGLNQSFMQLLRKVEGAAEDLYAFCDSDDVWLPTKLEDAVDQLSGCADRRRGVYFGRLHYVDTGLRSLALAPIPRRLGFGNAIVENVVTGPTVVIGSTIRDLLLHADPDDMYYWDWWTYLLGSSMGQLMFGMKPLILYRQHGSNFSQWQRSTLSRIASRAKEFSERRKSGVTGLNSLRQAAHFKETYNDQLPDQLRELLDEILETRRPLGSVSARLRYALFPGCRRNRFYEDIVLRSMIALGRH
jgi:glycosyltransferase involved in cell wall biosynthesis